MKVENEVVSAGLPSGLSADIEAELGNMDLARLRAEATRHFPDFATDGMTEGELRCELCTALGQVQAKYEPKLRASLRGEPDCSGEKARWSCADAEAYCVEVNGILGRGDEYRSAMSMLDSNAPPVCGRAGPPCVRCRGDAQPPQGCTWLSLSSRPQGMGTSRSSP